MSAPLSFQVGMAARDCSRGPQSTLSIPLPPTADAEENITLLHTWDAAPPRACADEAETACLKPCCASSLSLNPYIQGPRHFGDSTMLGTWTAFMIQRPHAALVPLLSAGSGAWLSTKPDRPASYDSTCHPSFVGPSL